jgi:hypothetical protein
MKLGVIDFSSKDFFRLPLDFHHTQRKCRVWVRDAAFGWNTRGA